MEKRFHGNGNSKIAEVTILISDKVDFKTKSMTKDKEEHHVIIKGSTQVQDITLVNMYAPNTGAPKYIKQILRDIKGETDNNRIGGAFNIPLTLMDRSSRGKINKETGS